VGNWKKTKIGEFLQERKAKFEPDSEEIQRLRKIDKISFSDGKIHLGKYKLTKTKQIIVEPGDFVFSGLNIEKGAVSINQIDESLVVSTNYSTCCVDYSIINQEYFLRFIKSPIFKQLLIDNLKKDYGFTRPKHLLPLEIDLPSIEEQKEIVTHFKSIETEDDELKDELTHQQTLLKKLRQQILQEAIEGKLTADLPRRQAGWRDKAFLNYSNKLVPEQSDSYFAYVLECEDGNLYKGFTQNLFKRINRHLEGRGAKKTQQSKPVKLIHFDIFSSEKEAIEREKYFKSGSGREWLNTIKKQREIENEPASELLARIQAEKDQLIKDKKIKKQKLLPVISEDEKPFELPEGWVWCQLQEITNLITDGKHGDCQNLAKSGYYFLSAKDIQNGELLYRNARQIVPDEFQEVHNRTNLEAGDICMVNTGATVGKLALAPDSPLTQKTTFQKSVAVIKVVRPFIEQRFIALLLTNETTKLLATSWGSAINNLLLGDLKKQLVSLPPLPEQKAIVAKVEKLLALCDQLETQITHNQNHANALMQAVLKEAFTQTTEQTKPVAANG